MPELPEVESIRRDLVAAVTGRSIARATVRNTGNSGRVIRRHQDRSGFEAPLAGRTILEVQRRGKFLIHVLDEKLALVVHLGMSGQLLLGMPADPYANHTHVEFDFEDGDQLRYVDPRTFGQLFVVERSEAGEIAELDRLGMDPLVAPMPWREFSVALAGRKTKLKSLLMDQSFICGIGNIYSDEMLFAAGLRYDRVSESLSEPEARRLHEAIGTILRRAVDGRGTSMRDEQYRDLYGNRGAFQHHLLVYARQGEPCTVCGSQVSRVRWTNRSTHFCPQCQR
ncbi:MAG: bifunctional DNA-formamidopyrimidine glycosylase/DNA-(apurinic or apyrimidinic site) lyase [Actinomycetota bacterium]